MAVCFQVSWVLTLAVFTCFFLPVFSFSPPFITFTRHFSCRFLSPAWKEGRQEATFHFLVCRDSLLQGFHVCSLTPNKTHSRIHCSAFIPTTCRLLLVPISFPLFFLFSSCHTLWSGCAAPIVRNCSTMARSKQHPLDCDAQLPLLSSPARPGFFQNTCFPSTIARLFRLSVNVPGNAPAFPHFLRAFAFLLRSHQLP